MRGRFRQGCRPAGLHPKEVRMRSTRIPALTGALLAAGFGVATSAAAEQKPRDYVVVYEAGGSAKHAHAAIADAGGKIVSENAAIGVATVRSSSAAFADRAARERAL